MKKFSYVDSGALLVWLLPVVYLVYVYPNLPISVPMHYGIDGQVDSYGSKNEFLMVQLFMIFVSLLVYLLLKFLPAIDPKKQVKYGEGTFQKIALGIVIFLSAINIAIIFATVSHGFKIEKLILPLVGLFFAFMGNMMHSIKPNYFAGVRTPWTLESEDNWRATHRLAGKLWFIGGIVITAIVLILPDMAATIVFLCTIPVLALIPVIYSYLYFKKHQLKA